MSSKSLLIGLSLLGMACLGCSVLSNSQRVSGNGHITEDQRPLDGFSKVHVSGSGSIQLLEGDEGIVVIRTDDNLLPYIRSEVSGGYLRIGPEPGYHLKPTQKIEYVVTFKHLEEVRFSGSIQGVVPHLKTDELNARISGSGGLEIRNLESDRLDVGISGSGRARFSGEALSQNYQISGSGDVEASRLEGAEADVQISGSGALALWVRDRLKARISGSGNLRYYGRPQLDVSTSGSGRVRGLGEPSSGSTRD